ncbi:V-snare-domain-containing protein [Jaminaea rosea]|uniref:V-snare-domain-containing protein n=1 Tax=Jaminaea rosea TaxID=1569628 RepID=A0A316UQM3_9BASI|nr:V-snare-domain-containing protein [Jaminaea rosea]PWN27612.1 V-snare-domain-containing protein [Jaminaea rosea]
MADLFESYSSDLKQLLSSLQSHLSPSTLQSQSGEARKATLRRCEMELDEAEEILAQMDIEVRGFPQSVKNKYSVQLRGFRGEVERVGEQVRSQMSRPAGSGYDPSNPFAESSSGAGNDADLERQSQRQRLLQGTATLEDGQRRLEESNRIALETEDLGADILRDLRGQREQIEHSRDTLRQADGNLERSSKTLTTMIRRSESLFGWLW